MRFYAKQRTTYVPTFAQSGRGVRLDVKPIIGGREHGVKNGALCLPDLLDVGLLKVVRLDVLRDNDSPLSGASVPAVLLNSVLL
jgi:hypothetical protein